uniref:AlNc14C183G8265 protein n=1 Tax=Albugo laibachii Nc14 TaxID=890382 RepID=F0W1V0_9STRA|nr:AlNc14C8G1030 [Albugo laibachii Nc14]CCA23166.1 AlNc14C183G8265 [Albugo laibachii Nc14]|eukprot:CCA23166.1 AlNc14C183G8265 [Albugo laibachii Nc14]
MRPLESSASTPQSNNEQCAQSHIAMFLRGSISSVIRSWPFSPACCFDHVRSDSVRLHFKIFRLSNLVDAYRSWKKQNIQIADLALVEHNLMR